MAYEHLVPGSCQVFTERSLLFTLRWAYYLVASTGRVLAAQQPTGSLTFLYASLISKQALNRGRCGRWAEQLQ